MSSSSSRRKKVRPPARPQVHAAGGIVWRTAFVADDEGEPRQGVEVVLVHRPRYDDWSFPKGKLDRGESFEAAAVREVAEETGLVCELAEELPSVRYLDGKGRLKLVRYWSMRATGLEAWAPNDEIDDRRWVPPAAAADLLTYGHDRVLLKAFTDGRDPGTHLTGGR